MKNKMWFLETGQMEKVIACDTINIIVTLETLQEIRLNSTETILVEKA